jgi:tellurite resistance protein TerC
MTYPLWMWIVFFIIVGALLVLDLGVLHRKNKEIKAKEALVMCGFYFTLAMLFGGWIFLDIGKQQGYEFFMGYLIELSLSVDNLFVFVLIFTHFMVPKNYQHRVLFWGILGAIVFRGIMIGLGTHVVHAFADILYLFGAILLFTGIKMLFAADAEPDVENNRIIRLMRGRFRITETYEEDKFFVRRNGVLWMTPLFMVLVLIEISDIVFAVDSIPAIFAITQDPFIILTSNIFAILGLRSLYFALAAIMHRFEYLKYGLSCILVLIGIKMLVNHHMNAKIIPTEWALFATLFILVTSVIVSMVKTGRAEKKALTAGWVPGSDAKPEKENT